MKCKFAIGQQVKIVRVDDIPYGMKYSYLEATLDQTGVIHDFDAETARYTLRLDAGGDLITISEGALEAVAPEKD
jgi:hypothetical protein